MRTSRTGGSLSSFPILFILVILLFTQQSHAAASQPHSVRTWQPSNGPDVDAAFVSEDSGMVTLLASNGKPIQLKLDMLGVEDLRYLRNIQEAVNPFRTWVLKTKDVQPPTDQTFMASFVKTVGFDTPLSKTFVVLIHDDGRKCGYPLDQFRQEDQDYVKTMPEQRPARTATASEPDDYQVKWTEYDPVKDKDIINYHPTRHFLFIWGNQVEPAAKNWSDEAFRQMNYRYFEDVWAFYQNVMHVPMPYAHDAAKYKTNIYITGTGLPKHKEGFAFGGLEIIIHPGAMLAGSSVIPHEFTHTLQLHMGGFRDNPNVGWFWECHANWSACQFIPSVALALEVYADRMHYELNSSRDNYGSWPFLQYFAEHPHFTPAFCYDIWTANRKDEHNAAIEDPFQTMMRLGVDRRAFKGDGIQGFGDMIGEMAAHNVTWDYVYGWTYREVLRNSLKALNDASRRRAVLQPVPDRPGWFAPLYAQSPRQYGINIIDLIPAPGARRIEADFRGIVDEKEGSDWRVMLVAIDAEGRARYSRMWHAGRGSITLHPGETRLALAIAACPSVYHSLGFRIGFNTKRHYPYEVSFVGCTPAPLPPNLRARPDVPGAEHPNGGGFVAATAHADPTAYVGKDAMVLDRAQVLDSARVEDHAVVSDDARLSNNVVVSGFSTVRNRVQISGDAQVGDEATVENEVRLNDRAKVRELIRVHGNGTIGGDALVKGAGDLYTGPDSPIAGGTIIGEDSEIHADAWHKPIDFGLMYGFMAVDQFTHDVQDNNYLYAHWDFSQPRREILKDAFADNDGVLRGNPQFKQDGASTVLSLNGKDQYVLLGGSPADTHAITVDMRIRWRGGPSMQRALTFGGPEGAFSFTPKDQAGRAAFFVRKGKTLQSLQAAVSLPVNEWTRVTFSLADHAATLYVDGKEAARTTAMTLHPDDLRPQVGYLGRNLEGSDFFNGDLADIAIYRTGFTTLPPPLPQATLKTSGL